MTTLASVAGAPYWGAVTTAAPYWGAITTASPLTTGSPYLGFLPMVATSTSMATPMALDHADPIVCNWQAFLLALALSGGAGIRATLPAFLLSLFHLFGDFEFSDYGQWLGYHWICSILGLIVVVEMVADCIPAVDHALHVVLVPAHPLMGAAIAVAPLYCGGWQAQAIMAVAGGTLALLVHSSKALFRVASSGSSGGALNPVVSTCETFSVLTLVLIVLMHPMIAIGAVGIFTFLGCMGCAAIGQAMEQDGKKHQIWRDSRRDEEDFQHHDNSRDSDSKSNKKGNKLLSADDADKVLLELEEQLDLEDELQNLTKDSIVVKSDEHKKSKATNWSWLSRSEQ